MVKPETRQPENFSTILFPNLIEEIDKFYFGSTFSAKIRRNQSFSKFF